jgi:hypothetical protein
MKRGSIVTLLLALILLGPGALSAHELVVQPYLQNASPDAIHVMWETDGGEESVVEWGPTDALGSATTGDAFVGSGASRHHHVELTALSPATRYHYRVVTTDAVSAIYDFVTPAEQSAEAPFRLVAMSDMQRDGGNPNVFNDVVEQGVIGFVASEFGADLPMELGLVTVAGDLVDNGWSYDQFADDFFEPSAALFRHVPVYPVPGNHEGDTPYFFDYFELPQSGGAEHWWIKDHGNLRLVGLDSNSAYRTAEQLLWLDGVLDDACVDPDIDFVFAQLHHPHRSELWLAGETSWTGDVIAQLESFSEACGKPSIHFFGHTHGYSRGQSRDHRHLMVNVATAGGNIDYWGEYAQQDYAEYTVSQDEWGFVLVEVEAGADPAFRLRRVSRGNEVQSRNNEVRDDLEVRLNAVPPTTPVALSPGPGDEVDPIDGVLLVSSLFAHAGGGAHGASQWQVATDCADWSAPVADVWTQHRNEYGGVDLQAGDDLGDELVPGLDPQSSYCWRVRHRDRGLSWSDWSEPAAFSTGGPDLTDNLLLNPGAEEGIDHWTVTAGTLESLTDGECNGVAPHSGERYFVAGGLCADEAEYASAVQRVGLWDHGVAIDSGRVTARFGGWLSDWSGDDVPAVHVVAISDAGETMATSEVLSSTSASWTSLLGELWLPTETREVDFVIEGTRSAGTDNDSYLDDLELRLLVDPEPGDDDDSAVADDDDSAVVDDDDDSAVADDDDAVVDDDDSAAAPELVDEDLCAGCGGEMAGRARVGAIGLLLLVAVARRRRA